MSRGATIVSISGRGVQSRKKKLDTRVSVSFREKPKFVPEMRLLPGAEMKERERESKRRSLRSIVGQEKNIPQVVDLKTSKRRRRRGDKLQNVCSCGWFGWAMSDFVSVGPASWGAIKI